MEDLLSLPVVVAIVLLCTLLLLELWTKNRKLPPGPWGVPFLGYYPFLSSAPYLDFARLSKKYGDVFSFRSAGGKLFVVLNGNKLIKEVLVNRSEEFIGRPLESNSLEWISDGLGVAQEEGAYWKEHRRYFLHTAKNFGFGKIEIEDTIHEEIKILIEDFKKINGEPTDVAFHLDYAFSGVITKIMFDRKFEKYGDIFPKLASSVHDLIHTISDHRLMLVGYPFRLAMRLLPWSEKVHQGKSFLKNTVKNIIDDHVATFDPKNLRDYVDSYLYQMEKLKESGELEKSSFTMERLLAISMNMTMEGTAADTIRSLLVEISRHPEEQRKAQSELDAVVGRERLPSWLDRPKLPYLEAFVQELYRTAQAFLVTTHYSNFEDTVINGYHIPKRSVILGNLRSISQDPKTYSNPTSFDVNRFLDKDKNVKLDGPKPFSVGKRDCVGQSLARMEVYLIIASMLQNFTLYPDTDERLIRLVPRN